VLDCGETRVACCFEAVNICNIFIPKGKPVVSTKGKIPDNNINYETLNAPLIWNIPVAV